MSADISIPALGGSGQCIYSTVGHVAGTPEAPRTETVKREQSSHPCRWAALCLCALFLAVIIVLCVLYLRMPTCLSKDFSDIERELMELRANYSRGIKEERKKNSMTFFAMLKRKYRHLSEYCPLSSQGSVCYPCPQDWKEFSSKCYLFSTSEKTWIDSQSHCRQLDADLVIIEIEEEQEFITNNTRDSQYWIGLSDAKTEGTWLWADKTSLKKGFWSIGEPDNHYWPGNKTQGKQQGANCVVTGPDENRWKDIHCYSEYKYVCETVAFLL